LSVNAWRIIFTLIGSIPTLRKTSEKYRIAIPFSLPAFAIAAAMAGIWGAAGFASALLRCVVYSAGLISLLYLLKIIRREDIRWIIGFIKQERAGS
jgi:hypothetical protein